MKSRLYPLYTKLKSLVIKVVLLIVAVFGTVNLSAQDRIELGGTLGVAYYFGDLNPSMQFLNSHLAVGGIGRYVFNDRLAFKGMAMYTNISGSYDGSNGRFVESTPDANYSFSRSIGDFSGQFEFNFLSYDHKFIASSTFTPYLSAGLGTIFYNRIEGDVGNNASKPVFILSLPFGVGAKYKINKWVRIGAEWSFRKTFVDDLDYVGDGGVDPSDPYGYGNTMTHNNDWISFANVYVTISMLKRKTRCNGGY
ncbi:DUF6089 family protein [Carboxylicivirga sp. N1Y90]|uniref:type IX secretion system protein PorG n=1 Tax=Carboxylicivirga fragile TaxID=3417571 RepID=UPI003D329DBB|nr:outer membrane beta-barrel protein [Marinilabiliaceae bacterium N1Y90]